MRAGGKKAAAIICLALVTWAVGCATPGREKADDRQKLAQASIEQFVKIRSPSSAALAPNGDLYYIDLEDGVRQLFRRGAAGGGDAEAQPAVCLTQFEDGIGGYSLSDDGRWIAITAGRGGDEQYDIHLLDTARDELSPLMVDRETVFGSVVWRRDSKAFAYRANKDEKSDFNVYVYDLRDERSKKVWSKPGYWYPVDFNAAGDRLVVSRYVSASETYVYEVSLTGLGARPLNPTAEQWAYFPVGYYDGDGALLLVSDYRGDRQRVFSLDMRSGELTSVLPQFGDHDIDDVTLHPDRDLAAVVVNEDGYGTLHLFTLPGFIEVDGPEIDKGVVGNVRFEGDNLLYSLNNANTPGLVYRWSLAAPDLPPTQLTEARLQGIDVGAFPLPRLVHYRSFDGLEVPAFLYLPPGHDRGEPIPFIASYHGGPEAQFRPRFRGHYLYFLSRGFGIIAPNVRGSAGYGRTYLEMDNYKKRMDSVRDGVAAARWLIDNGYSDNKMIAAYGGSYGGFMVMAVVTEAPEVYGAACNVVGIVNFQTFLERTKAYRRALREAEYGPLSDPEFLRSISPLHLVDRIQAPVLIAHGRNDPRVPLHEAEQVYEALRDRGRRPKLLVFDDEGHGFRKQANRIEFYRTLADFFEEHLVR